jgi:hypothetical protein
LIDHLSIIYNKKKSTHPTTTQPHQHRNHTTMTKYNPPDRADELFLDIIREGNLGGAQKKSPEELMATYGVGYDTQDRLYRYLQNPDTIGMIILILRTDTEKGCVRDIISTFRQYPLDRIADYYEETIFETDFEGFTPLGAIHMIDLMVDQVKYITNL